MPQSGFSDTPKMNGDHSLDNDKTRKAVEAAKLYYLRDYSQNQIAEALGVSRPTVSRLLRQAKDEGFVTVEIHDPLENVEALAERVRDRFGLKRVIVAYTPSYEDYAVKKYIGQAAAAYLHELVKDGDTIGASWGSTMYQVALHLKTKTLQGASVVQLNGGVTDADVLVSPSEIVHLFGRAFNVTPYFMYLPAIMDQRIVKDAILTDRHIRRVLDLGRSANIAVFTAGAPTPDSVLINSNYFRGDEVERIRGGAAGDICSRYYDSDGEICLPELDGRTIGIELAELRVKEHAILVAGGPDKIKSIYGALKGKYGNTLVTDHITAKALLDKGE